MKTKWVEAYLDVAERFAQLSSAKRLQVGAVIVKDHRIISIGYNGMPAGDDNCCEAVLPVPDHTPFDQFVKWDAAQSCYVRLTTKPEVIHAEANAIAKLARSSESGLESIMFITHAPCIECAKMIYGAGITKVYYRNVYRCDAGVGFLQNHGVEVHHSQVVAYR